MNRGVTLTKRLPICLQCRSANTYYSKGNTLLLRRTTTSYAKRQHSTPFTFPSRLLQTPALVCSIPIIKTHPTSNQFQSTPITTRKQHSTPSEIESARAKPPQTKLEKLLHNLHRIFNEWLLEPLLTFRRFIHIVFIFAPVILVTPITLIGSRVEEEQDERIGTLWWYDIIAAQMERAGPTFIKVRFLLNSSLHIYPATKDLDLDLDLVLVLFFFG